MIDFLKYQKLGFYFFAFTLGLFAITYIYKLKTRGHTFVYSVDFTGGTQILFNFAVPVTGEQISRLLESEGLTGAVTRDFSEKKILVRIQQFENDAVGIAERLKNIINKKLPLAHASIEQIDSVGAGIGETLRWKSAQAVIVGLLLMLLYIAARFWSWGFALGAVVSLFHDALVILTIFLLFDLEISINVIGAILAVLGYSINDTIIIFSRIRERKSRITGESDEFSVNMSITETLRRTLLTSFATTLVVVSLILFGGEVLRGLSLVLLIGFTFGTYSSIFVASPVMLLVNKLLARQN